MPKNGHTDCLETMCNLGHRHELTRQAVITVYSHENTNTTETITMGSRKVREPLIFRSCTLMCTLHCKDISFHNAFFFIFRYLCELGPPQRLSNLTISHMYKQLRVNSAHILKCTRKKKYISYMRSGL